MITSLLLATVLQTTAVSAGAQFVTHVQDSYPALSPDGRTLVFQSNQSGGPALYVSDADGGSARVLVDSGDNPVTPSWSPDGRQIAFAATVGGNSEIFVINADGSNRRRLTNDPADDSHPHFARSGRLFSNSGTEHLRAKSRKSTA